MPHILCAVDIYGIIPPGVPVAQWIERRSPEGATALTSPLLVRPVPQG